MQLGVERHAEMVKIIHRVMPLHARPDAIDHQHAHHLSSQMFVRTNFFSLLLVRRYSKPIEVVKEGGAVKRRTPPFINPNVKTEKKKQNYSWGGTVRDKLRKSGRPPPPETRWLAWIEKVYFMFFREGCEHTCTAQGGVKMSLS